MQHGPLPGRLVRLRDPRGVLVSAARLLAHVVVRVARAAVLLVRLHGLSTYLIVDVWHNPGQRVGLLPPADPQRRTGTWSSSRWRPGWSSAARRRRR